MAPKPACASNKLDAYVVTVLCFVNFNEALQGNIIWPFIPFAVQKWGASPEQVGLYAGILASSFFAAQLLCVTAWGRAADIYGRRPCLLAGLIGTGLTMTLFGFARSFGVALLARFLTGALNGNIALSKTYMGEVTTAESISRGFAWLSLTWGVGAVIAPAIGGFLADPVENFPATFGGVHLFELYPYVLPSLVSAAFSFIAFFIGYRHLGETQVYLDAKAEDEASHDVVNDAAEGTPRRAHDGRASRSSSRASAPEQHEAAHASEADSCVEDARPVLRMQAPDVEHGEQQHARSEVGVEDVRTPAALRAAYGRPHQRRHSIVAGEAGSSESARLSEASVHSGARAGAGATLVSSLDAVVSFAGDGVQAEDDALLSPSGDAHTATSSRQRSYEHAHSSQRARRSEEHDVLVSPRSEECTDSEQELVHTPSLASRSHPHANGGSGNDGRGSGSGNGSGSSMRRSQSSASMSVFSLLKRPAVVWSVAAYALLALLSILLEELIPVFCKTDTRLGGLSFDSVRVGTVQIVSGITQMLFQLFVFPALNHKHGPLRVFRYAILPCVLFALLPAVHRVAGQPVVLWVLLCIFMMYKTGATTMCFTSVMIAINNASEGRNLGLINGFAQSAASLARVVGPTLGGAIFSASISWDALGEWRLHSAFVAQAVLAFLAWLAALRIPDWVATAPVFQQQAKQQAKGRRAGRARGNSHRVSAADDADIELTARAE